MIARNYRKYPEALAMQLTLQLACVVVRLIRERHSGRASPSPGKVLPQAACEATDVPVGAIVQTPTGKRARVLGYRGYGQRGGVDRDHRVRLWCQYLQPENKAFDKVLLVPELVTVIELGQGEKT